MRLDEVAIDNYGPLDARLEFGDGVSVIYGPNESGKTLLVDALLLMLAGENDDDRVGQDPVGYVTVDEGDGVRRLDDGETILDRLEARHGVSLGVREFRNTFVVRSADSHLSDEDGYYDRATDIVAESLVEDIDRVREAIRDRGRITPTGRLIDRSTKIETKTHHEAVRTLRGEIDAFVAEARGEGLHSLETDLFETELEIDRKDEEVARLQAARRRQEYEAQLANRDELEANRARLAELPDEGDLDELADDVEAVMGSVERVDSTETRRSDSQAVVRRAVAATAISLVVVFGVGAWVLSVLGLSLLGFIAVALAAVLVAAIPGAIAWYFWQVRESAEADLSELQTDRAAVLQRGHALGFEADDLAGLLRSVAERQRRIRELRGTVRELHGELKGVLDLPSDTPTETLEGATAALDRRAAEPADAVEVEYTEGALEAARSELDELEDRRNAIVQRLEEARDDMRSFGTAAADVPFSKYDLEPPRTDVETLEGLEALADRLTELVETIETDADNARGADDVLKALKEDEQSRVGELFFGAESAVSEYFSGITDGRYESVHYDEGDNELWVRTTAGSSLKPSQLSHSTFDQLYFAVRLAFASELFDDGSGFLLLDDAFLAADPTRLERQVEIVCDLANDGWQILYFTAKESARNRLAGESGTDVLTLERLE